MNKYLILTIFLVIVLIACNPDEGGHKRFNKCLDADKLKQQNTKVAIFPLSDDLKIFVQKSWIELSYEDDNVSTTYVADSTLYVQSGKTLSIALSSSKDKFEIPEISIQLVEKYMNKSLQIMEIGETVCYDKKCIWQLVEDDSMSYLSFFFIHDSRLRIINASTDFNKDELDHMLCQIINILSTDGK
ncbi:MAG: hypothetical protein WBA17_08995 [Saprospiraceae bacterium]